MSPTSLGGGSGCRTAVAYSAAQATRRSTVDGLPALRIAAPPAAATVATRCSLTLTLTLTLTTDPNPNPNPNPNPDPDPNPNPSQVLPGCTTSACLRLRATVNIDADLPASASLVVVGAHHFGGDANDPVFGAVRPVAWSSVLTSRRGEPPRLPLSLGSRGGGPPAASGRTRSDAAAQ